MRRALAIRPVVPVITYHALLRWLERVHGIDVEFFRAQLAAEVKPYVGVKAIRVHKAGVTYCFKGDTLATVIATKGKL